MLKLDTKGILPRAGSPTPRPKSPQARRRVWRRIYRPGMDASARGDGAAFVVAPAAPSAAAGAAAGAAGSEAGPGARGARGEGGSGGASGFTPGVDSSLDSQESERVYSCGLLQVTSRPGKFELI